jgi:hypothetical protein
MIFYLYFIVLSIAFLSGLYQFRRLSRSLKLLTVLLGLTCLVECFAVLLFRKLHLKTNVPIYNCFMLVEFIFYGMYFKWITESKWLRNTIVILLIFFSIFWIFSTFYIFTIQQWNSYFSVAESIFVVCLAAKYYQQLLTSKILVSLKSHPEFWIATGMILFYSCDFPYLGMLNYLVKNFYHLSQKLLYVLDLLNIIMYTLFSYAFLCRIPIRKFS